MDNTAQHKHGQGESIYREAGLAHTPPAPYFPRIADAQSGTQLSLHAPLNTSCIYSVHRLQSTPFHSSISNSQPHR